MNANNKQASYVVFDYLYRDASNYKVFGSAWLAGTLTKDEQSEIFACCSGGEFFIAEQIGIPALYQGLYEHGGGPTEDDHVWHTLEGFRNCMPLPTGGTLRGEAPALLAAFRAAKGNWQQELSPNFI